MSKAVTLRHAGRSHCAVFLVAVLAFLAAPVEIVRAGEQKIGTVSEVRGPVTLKRTGYEGLQHVAVGDAVATGDVIVSGAGARAQVTLADESLVLLSQDSSIRVNQFSIDPTSNRRTAVVRVLRGMVRTVVFKVRSPDSDLTVESGTASVIFDNLGDCIVVAGPGSTEVVALEQTVRVKNVLPYVIGEMRTNANQKVLVPEKSPPSSPVTVSPDERGRLLRDFRSR